MNNLMSTWYLILWPFIFEIEIVIVRHWLFVLHIQKQIDVSVIIASICLQTGPRSPAMSPPMKIHIGGSNTVMVSPQPQLQSPPPLVHNASHFSGQPMMSSAPLTSQPPPLLHNTQTTGTMLPSINNLPTPVIHPNTGSIGKNYWNQFNIIGPVL